MKLAGIMLGLSCAAFATPSLAAPAVADGSFETPALGYGGYVYNPSVAGVTFNPKSGVAHNGSPFSSENAPDGTQYAFIQSTDTQGSVSLDVTGLTSGAAYNFIFSAAQRPNYTSNVLTAFFNGVNLGTFNPTSTAFSLFTTSSFTASGSSGTLTFMGAPSTTGDNDTALDNVRVNALAATSAVPEPATWAMMLAGFGLIGVSVRSRRKQSPSLIHA